MTTTDSGSASVFSGRNGDELHTFNGDSAGDAFGWSVSRAGDVNADGHADLIVGAHLDDNAGTDSGSARVFSGKDGAELFTFDGHAAGALFGYSVSGAGDVNGDGYDDVIVGALNSGSPGQVHIFSGKTGVELYTLIDSLGFGVSVSGAGDVNGDGLDDFVVGSFRRSQALVFASNIAPTADVGGPYLMVEGDVLMLDGSGSSDPEGENLTYAWDLDYDGTTFDVNATSETPDFAGVDDGDVTVALRVSDGSQFSDIVTATVTVSNVDPVLNRVGTSAETIETASADGVVTLNGTVSDAGIPDTHTVTVDWGDGTVEEIADGSLSQPVLDGATHEYANGGIYTITVTAVDDDGGTATVQTQAVVSGNGVLDGVLYVIGTGERDRINVNRKGKDLIVNDRFGKTKTVYNNSDINAIQVFGGADRDYLRLNKRVTQSALIDGGAGKDSLWGGRGDDTILGQGGHDRIDGHDGENILVGGNGHDRIWGGTDRDLVIGGRGADRLESKGGENLLISGSTSFDDNLESLKFIMNEWTSNRVYATRIENIRNGEGATHGFALVADHTVADDADEDFVRGGTQNDWFFANSDIDRLWRSADEILDDMAD